MNNGTERRYVPDAQVENYRARGFYIVDPSARLRPNSPGRGNPRGNIEDYRNQAQRLLVTPMPRSMGEDVARKPITDYIPMSVVNNLNTPAEVKRALAVYGGLPEDQIHIEPNDRGEWKLSIPGLSYSSGDAKFDQDVILTIPNNLENNPFSEVPGQETGQGPGAGGTEDQLGTSEYGQYLDSAGQRFIISGVDKDTARQWTQRIDTLVGSLPIPEAAKIWEMLQAGFEGDLGAIEQVEVMLGESLTYIYEEIAQAYNPTNIHQSVNSTYQAARQAGMSQERAQELADHVLWEYESSAVGFSPQAMAAAGKYFAPRMPSAQQQYTVPSFGGGGGGYSVKRVYEPPDRREVEKQVREYMGRVIGTQPNDQVDRLVNMYMKQHREKFDNPGNGISPWFSVEEEVRKIGGYDYVHKFRPDSVGEEDWLSMYQDTIRRQTDLAPSNLDEFSRNAAAGAWSQQATQRGAIYQQRTNTGQSRPGFFNKIADATYAIARNM